MDAGNRVEVRNIPWKGVIGTYVRRHKYFGHIVELGDFVSGGTARRVWVTKVRPAGRIYQIGDPEVLTSMID